MKKSFIILSLICTFFIACDKKVESNSTNILQKPKVNIEAAKSNSSSKNQNLEMASPKSGIGGEVAYLEKSNNTNSVSDKIQIPKKIVKEGEINISINDIKSGKYFIDSILRKCNGFYENEVYNSSTRNYSYNLTLNIPAENFDLFIMNLENGEGRINQKNIKVSDETQNYIDLDSRLNTKKTYLEKYKDLLKKTNSMQEILEIQERIRNLEEELESTQKSLKTLNYNVAYSHLSIYMVEQNPNILSIQDNNETFWFKLSSSFKNGWTGFLDFVLIIVNFWFLILIAVIILIFILKFRKKILFSNQHKNKTEIDSPNE